MIPTTARPKAGRRRVARATWRVLVFLLRVLIGGFAMAAGPRSLATKFVRQDDPVAQVAEEREMP